MDIRYFIGVDISKATLDWAVFDGKTIVLQSQSANSEAGIKATLKLIKVLPGFKVTESVCCMEHTGIYNAHLLACLYKLSFPLCRAAGRLESSLQIKKADGLQRGKTDAIDAQRIAEYARGGGPLSLSRSDAPMATAPPCFTETGCFEQPPAAADTGSSATTTTPY